MNFLKFLIQNPDSVNWGSAAILLGHVLDLSFCLLLGLGFAGIGKLIFKSQSLPVSFVIGETLCAFFIMALGLAGFLTPKVLIPIFILIAALGLVMFEKPQKWDAGFSPVQTVSAGLILLVLAACAVHSGTPPTDWDSLAYHLAFPKIFLRESRLAPLDWSFNIHYPLNPEMIYTLVFSLRGAQAVHWMNFLHGCLLISAIFHFTKKHFSTEAALLAPAVFACQPIFWRVNGNASTDFAVALAGFLAVAAWIEDKPPFLTGLLAGAAASSKITGLWVVSSLLVLQIHRPRKLVPFISGALLFGFPWYLRNWIWKGNPFWPYFGKIFGAVVPDLDLAARSLASVTEGFPKTVLNWVLSPILLVLKQNSFGQKTFFLVPVFLTFLTWKTLKDRESSWPDSVRKILSFLVVFGSIWFWVYQGWRYLLPAAILMAILIAAWATEKNGKVFRFAASALLILAVSPIITLNVNTHLHAFFGLKSKISPGLPPQERYLEVMLGPPYLIMREANRLLPPNAKVVLHRDVRGFFLDREYAWGGPLNPGAIPFDRIHSADEVRLTLLKKGYTHVLYNPFIKALQGDPEYYLSCSKLMEAFLASGARPILNYSGLVLYEIRQE